MVSVATNLSDYEDIDNLDQMPEVPLEPTPLPNATHEGEVHLLRRSGKRPLRLRAHLIAEATGWTTGSAAWHELTILRRTKGEHVVALKVFKKSPAETDVFHAEIFGSLDEAVTWLESYDPTSDLSTDIDLDDEEISPLEMTLKAVALRQRMIAIRRDYHALLGELLLQLGVTE